MLLSYQKFNRQFSPTFAAVLKVCFKDPTIDRRYRKEHVPTGFKRKPTGCQSGYAVLAKTAAAAPSAELNGAEGEQSDEAPT